MIFSLKKYILWIYFEKGEIIITEVSKIQKWGNSQGIRIPKKMLETLNLKVNDSISIEEEEDCLKIKKIETELSNIEKLFLNYDGEYEKIDLDWDNEVGKEIW